MAAGAAAPVAYHRPPHTRTVLGTSTVPVPAVVPTCPPRRCSTVLVVLVLVQVLYSTALVTVTVTVTDTVPVVQGARPHRC
jgi:hypothetical protein